MLKAGQNSITCVAPFIQRAAAFALTAPENQKATESMRLAYARRRDLVLRLSHELECEKVLVTPPTGRVLLLPRFSSVDPQERERDPNAAQKVGELLVAAQVRPSKLWAGVHAGSNTKLDASEDWRAVLAFWHYTQGLGGEHTVKHQLVRKEMQGRAGGSGHARGDQAS